MSSADNRLRLLYIPGLDGTGRLLHRQARLHERYDVQCIAFPQDNVHVYADLVDRVIDALAQRPPGVVLAESFGGAIALMAALRRPELIERMVLVNTFAYFPRTALIALMAWLGRYLPPRPGHPATRRVRGWFFFSRDIPLDERHQWWERTADVPQNVYGWRLQLLRDLDLRPQLHRVHTPVLVVAAPDDRVVPPCAGIALARRLPNARLITPAVGHGALIHPRMDVAALLDEPRYWLPRRTAAMAASPAGSRLG